MPTLSQLYQSRNKSDQRNTPRSRAQRHLTFLQRSDDKRQWWSEGADSTTQNTTATHAANFGSKLPSIPLRYQSSRTSTTTTTQGSRSHQSSSLLRSGPPSPLLTRTSQTTSSRKLSTRFTSRSTLSPGTTTSQDRSPPMTLTNVTTRGAEESYLPGTIDGEQLPASPPAAEWPFTRASRTLPDRAATASSEPLHGHGAATTSSGWFSMGAPGDLESGARPYVNVDEIQVAQSPKYDC